MKWDRLEAQCKGFAVAARAGRQGGKRSGSLLDIVEASTTHSCAENERRPRKERRLPEGSRDTT
jgi:hypothetical protein